MEALAAGGNVAEALRVYEDVRCLLRDELGTTPGPALVAVHERLLHADAAAPPGAAPPLRPPGAVRRRPLRPHRRAPPAATSSSATARWPPSAPLAEEALGGEGRVVIVDGPAGIGKTRLLAEARRRAAAAGALTLFARAGELERDFPFGVVRQLFEAALADPAERERALAGAAAGAGQVFGAPDAGSESDDASFAVLHGLYWLALNLAARPPAPARDRRPPVVRPAVAALRRLPRPPARGAADPRRGDRPLRRAAHRRRAARRDRQRPVHRRRPPRAADRGGGPRARPLPPQPRRRRRVLRLLPRGDRRQPAPAPPAADRARVRPREPGRDARAGRAGDGAEGGVRHGAAAAEPAAEGGGRGGAGGGGPRRDGGPRERRPARRARRVAGRHRHGRSGRRRDPAAASRRSGSSIRSSATPSTTSFRRASASCSTRGRRRCSRGWARRPTRWRRRCCSRRGAVTPTPSPSCATPRRRRCAAARRRARSPTCAARSTSRRRPRDRPDVLLELGLAAFQVSAPSALEHLRGAYESLPDPRRRALRRPAARAGAAASPATRRRATTSRSARWPSFPHGHEDLRLALEAIKKVAVIFGGGAAGRAGGADRLRGPRRRTRPWGRRCSRRSRRSCRRTPGSPPTAAARSPAPRLQRRRADGPGQRPADDLREQRPDDDRGPGGDGVLGPRDRRRGAARLALHRLREPHVGRVRGDGARRPRRGGGPPRARAGGVRRVPVRAAGGDVLRGVPVRRPPRARRRRRGGAGADACRATSTTGPTACGTGSCRGCALLVAQGRGGGGARGRRRPRRALPGRAEPGRRAVAVPARPRARLRSAAHDEAVACASEELALAEAFGAPRAIGRALRTLGEIEGSVDRLRAAVDVLARLARPPRARAVACGLRGRGAGRAVAAPRLRAGGGVRGGRARRGRRAPGSWRSARHRPTSPPASTP